MREQKNIYYMNDRELRAYKWKLRRRREKRRRAASLLAAVCAVILCIFSFCSFTTRAKDSEAPSLKYYTGVIVKSGDSLWDIADEYIDYDQYKDKTEYINEVCSINNLTDASEIRAGQRLVVPYYSSEFMK